MDVAALSVSQPCKAVIQTKVNHRVRDVALRALAEGVLALALNLTIITFFATPVAVGFLTAYLAAHLLIWGYESLSNSISDRDHLEKAKELQTASRMSLGCAIANGGAGIAVHEAGHATAIWALLKGSSPKIFIRPFRGGMTTFQMSGKLTRVGKFFGLPGSMAIIAIAGVAASVFTAMGQLAIYERIRESYPVVKDVILGHALTQLVTEVFYGISALALKVKVPGHDFQALWLCGGGHQLVSITLIVALTTIEFLVLRYLLPKMTTPSVQSVSAPLLPT